MTTVTGTVIRPGGEPLADARIEIKLVASTSDPNASGYIPADETEVWTPQTLRTDAAGSWTADLPPTAGADNVFSQTGLVYKVIYQIGRTDGVHYIDVPDSGSALWVGGLLVDPPDDLGGGTGGGGPTTAALVLVDTTNFDLNLSAADSTVQAALDTLDDLISGAGGLVDSVNGQTGIVILGAADVDAVPTSAAGVTGGFAPLDGSALIPTSFLPPFVSTVQGSSGVVQLDAADIPFDPTGFTGTLVGSTQLQEVAAIVDGLDFTGGTVTSVNGETGIVTLTAADVGAVDLTAVDAPDGVAPLDGTAKVPVLNLPPFVSTIDGQSGAVDVVGTMVALDTVTFDGVLDGTTVDVQALAQKVDDLTFIGAGAVDSVNSQIGVVQLNALNIPVDASAFSGNLDASDTDVQSVADALDALVFPPDAVDSVNGQTGVVVLDAAAVGALDLDLLAAANGVAPLDVDGFVPYINLPPLVTSVNAQTGDAVLTSNEIAVDSFGLSGNAAGTATVQDIVIVVDGLGIGTPGEVLSINGEVGDVILTAIDVGAVDLTAVGAVNGVAPLDAASLVPTTNLPDLVYSINSQGGVVDLGAADIPLDDSGFVDNLVGITDVQSFADLFDTFAGGGSGGGHTLEEAGTPFTQRANLNFLAPFDLTDNSGADSTEVGLVPATTRTFLGVYSTTEVDDLVNTTAANVGKRVAVRVATTANITIATALNNGDTLDGVTLATDDVVLVKNQTAPAENGVYVVGVSPARDADFNTWDDYPASLATVNAGTVGAQTVWLCTSNTGGTLNTTAITYSQISTGATGTMAAQNANAVAITGGTITGLSDLTMATSAWSGGVLTGGKIANGALHLSQTYTQTANNSDIAPGTPIRIEWNPTLNYANPHSQSGWYGPRGLINTEGFVSYSANSATFEGTPISFASMLRIGNTPTQTRTIVPGWSIIGADIHVADGATVSTARNDYHTGGASFVDSRTVATANSGVYNHTGSELIGFLSGPMVLGNSTVTTRVGFDVKDVNDYPGGAQVIAIGLDSVGVVDNADVSVGTVTNNIGIRVPRMTLGTNNTGIRCDSTMSLWQDTNTFTAQPTNVITIGGTHTFNYTGGPFTGANLSLVEGAGIYISANDTSPFGFVTGLNIHPTIRPVNTLASSTFMPINQTAIIQPTYQCDGQAVTYGTIRNFVSSASFGRALITGSMTVTEYTDFYCQPTVNANVSMTQRYGLRIRDKAAGGTGTIVNQVGVQIENLAVTGGTAYGIINFNDTILQGTVFGGIPTGSNLTLRTTGEAVPTGTIKLDNPRSSFIANYTATTGGINSFASTAAITMNVTTNSIIKGFVWAPTITFQKDGGVNAINGVGFIANHNVGLVQNDSGGGARAFGAMAAFSDNMEVRCNNTGGNAFCGSVFYVSFDSHPYLERRTNGTLLINDLSGFISMTSMENGVAVLKRSGIRLMDPDGAGTLTTNIAVEIQPLAKGTTNIGLQNASTTVYPESVTTVSSVGAIILPTTTVVRLNNTTAGSITLTSQPTILNGQDNQVIIVYNGSAQNVVLQDQGTQTGSNLRLMTTTVVLTPRDSVQLMYSATVGDWLQISPIATVI